MGILNGLRRSVALLFLVFWACGAQATTDVAGIGFDDATTVAGQSLALNGAGLRTRMVFKVYAIGLYLPQRAGNLAAILSAPGAKRIRLVTLRDLDAEQFVGGLLEGLKKNHTPQELASLQPSIDAFRNIMLSLKETPKGTQVLLDSIPGSGTRLTVGGTRRGDDIPNEGFYPALLRIWLGEHPADDELKQALLGKGS
ncbi:chalcone isomerase family protein [Azoarcus sp. KH32C]|uniref:chalcone isomerase family protein n=1 Tax=Azoarcus sp. KH32C TaxID=748247 RepID=UPI00023863A2|nr:chalcone isomerase family protein [Azoarcus sp. KH32C]BAL23597.1 putative lipoprotein transmembrane [Azoarcus sp. KH32C]